MAGDRTRGLRPAGDEDPVWRLWRALPEPWRGAVIGPGVEGWENITENIDYKLNLTGLPELIQAEMAWMAHWQATDGTRASVLALSQLANILRRAIRDHHPFPPSLRQMDWEAASALQTWFYTTRWGRFPSAGVRARLRVVFRFARTALIAACHEGPWWELDYWHPRCDPRIPLSSREPMAHYGCTLTLITHPWLREAVKWCLGTLLEAGTLRWTTVSQERLRCLHRFDRWLQIAFDNPLDVLGDPTSAAGQAAAFRRWLADPANRCDPGKPRRMATKVAPRLINDDLRAVGELFEFMAANHDEAGRVLGPLAAPWARVTAAHAASWFRQVSRIPHERLLNDEHYVDDRALGQITAALPLLGLPKDQQMPITRSDGQAVTADGMDDPQAMRMILLQILTGRRSSEIRLCDFDCLSAPTDRAVEAAEGEDIARFRYAQSKIDIAPDTILVDSEVVAIIEEQQRWVRARLPGVAPKHLFVQLLGNRSGVKPYPSGTYNWRLREFSSLVRITDGKERPVQLSHTHRFRHTKLTRLAELGLPIHVLQRYAGHATPSMSMHYIAHREEHAEQAFLATRKLKADGTTIVFSRDDHDRLHLFDRADRFLPHGWCLLPPLQTCDKGNSCLTCSVFVTDDTHTQTLARQLEETEALIHRTATAFLQRHGRPMPDDNVWLAQRHAERAALQRLLTALEAKPGRACQGAGCPTTPATGPVPITLQRPGTPQ
ncbi:tyrosine-type recombinase/integrase [Gandjariella thermophila]|uniref:Putative transposase/phage integrase n=1 Tax=Gandjariella thermophila TaxID=1931992 RepID=A0A4D4JG92_9PSEU|nr:tyrosine-type recombinase/integrase [Gandjariella thermophila]GDY34040.1 putative transposase/phage integrase [Gandjariella thermophila]